MGKKPYYKDGVYIPVNVGTEKNLFWKKFLDYSEKNIDENVLMMGFQQLHQGRFCQ